MTTDARTGMTILEHDECWALLRSAEVGRLAIAVMDQPDIFPVNYVVDHGAVVFRTAEGTKLAGAVLGHGVAFEVDGYEPDEGEAWSVVLKGRAVELDQMQEVFDACDLPLFPWLASPKPRFVRIEPESLTGRRFRVVDHTAAGVPSTGAHRSAPE
jgi:nitroimidazol reductase NimA-like FMN-containing flavoprotein (pyridoxamine 5'-phosphate oxidase superfamily)